MVILPSVVIFLLALLPGSPPSCCYGQIYHVAIYVVYILSVVSVYGSEGQEITFISAVFSKDIVPFAGSLLFLWVCVAVWDGSLSA